MSYVKALSGIVLLLAVSACSGSNYASQTPTAAPSGLRTAGSASVTGGAAAAPAGAGDVGRTRY